LNEAVALGRQAVAVGRIDDPDWPMYLSDFGAFLQARFERTGDPADLDEAVKVGRQAVTATPADRPARGGYLSNLGFTMLVRLEHTGDPALPADHRNSGLPRRPAGGPADAAPPRQAPRPLMLPAMCRRGRQLEDLTFTGGMPFSGKRE
jgi:hypothetical protein